MKRLFTIFTFLIAISFALSGCIFGQKPAPQTVTPSVSPSGTYSHSEHSDDATASSGDTTASPTPSGFSYRLDYSIIPDAIKPKLTKADIEAYNAVIDAFAEYDTSITVSANDGIKNLAELIDLCFPVFFADVRDSAFKIEGNTVSWSYNESKDKHYELINSFEDIVLDKLYEVNYGKAKDASSLMRMLVLYKRITVEMNYHYESQSFFHGECELSEDEYMNHSYDALSAEKGVCWCYARAYAFLLNHAGFEAFTVSCDGGIGHHEWTMFNYDGSWFFADPTWDMNGTLNYFGMTAKNREADEYFLVDMKYFAGAAYPVSEDFEINDTRFSDLVTGTLGSISSYDLDYKRNRIVIGNDSFLGLGEKVYFDLSNCEIIK